MSMLIHPNRFKFRGQLNILDLETVITNPKTGLPWAVGDVYRFAFVSSGARDGSSSTISDYNTFIQNLANAAGLGTDIFGNSINWKAIVSTPTVDARDNIDARIGTDPDGPVFLMDGVQYIANNLADLWDGNIDTRLDLDEDGNLRPNDTPIWTSWCGVWTGSQSDGQGYSGQELGSGGSTRLGLARAELKFWLNRANNSDDTYDLAIYGMSEPLKIQPGLGDI